MTSSRIPTATNEYKTESLIAKEKSCHKLPFDPSTLWAELSSSHIDAVRILPDGRILVAHTPKSEQTQQYKLSVLKDIQSKSILQEIDLLERGNYLLPLSDDKLLCQSSNTSNPHHIAATFCIDLTNQTSIQLPNLLNLNNSFLLNKSNLVTLESDPRHPSKQSICQYTFNFPITLSNRLKIAKLAPSRGNFYDAKIVAYSKYLSGCFVEYNDQLNLYRYIEQTNEWTLDPSKNIDLSPSHSAPIKRLHTNENDYVVSCHDVPNDKVVFSLWDPSLEKQKNIIIENDIRFVDHVTLLPDNKTLIASFLTGQISGLCILDCDSQQYQLIHLPAFIASLQVLPSGELLIATIAGHLIPIDIECMKIYRETVTSNIRDNTSLIEPLVDLAASYLYPRMFAKPKILLENSDLPLVTDNIKMSLSNP